MGKWVTAGAFGGTAASLLLGAAAAGVVRFGLDEPLSVAAVAGGGVWLLVMLNYLVSNRQARRAGLPATGGRIIDQAKPVELIAPPETTSWLRRAQTAARRLEEHRAACAHDDGPGAASPLLLQVLSDAAAQARTAAEQLGNRAAALAVIDHAMAGGDSRDLQAEHARLTNEAERLPPGPVRQAKESSARAVADRVGSLNRLEELRQLLLATLESLTLRLEAVAEHGGMLLSVQVASDAAAATLDLTPLTSELQAVQTGLDQLEELSRTLASGRPEIV
jgi:hypothetical protein